MESLTVILGRSSRTMKILFPLSFHAGRRWSPSRISSSFISLARRSPLTLIVQWFETNFIGPRSWREIAYIYIIIYIYIEGAGKAETEREKPALRRMMNGGVMVVSRAKSKYEWSGEEKYYTRKTARLEKQGGRLGVACDSWFINALSKKPSLSLPLSLLLLTLRPLRHHSVPLFPFCL